MGGVSGASATLNTEGARPATESVEPVEVGGPAVDWFHAGAIAAVAGAAARAAVMKVSEAIRRAAAPRPGRARTG
jgi:hypothetical protein